MISLCQKSTHFFYYLFSVSAGEFFYFYFASYQKVVSLLVLFPSERILFLAESAAILVESSVRKNSFLAESDNTIEMLLKISSLDLPLTSEAISFIIKDFIQNPGRAKARNVTLFYENGEDKEQDDEFF